MRYPDGPWRVTKILKICWLVGSPLVALSSRTSPKLEFKFRSRCTKTSSRELHHRENCLVQRHKVSYSKRMRRNGRGTFGGSSGVWWRRPNRLSIGSATSKGTAETSRMSLDSVDTVSSDHSLLSPTASLPDQDDEDRFILQPMPLIKPLFDNMESLSDVKNDDLVEDDDNNSIGLFSVDDKSLGSYSDKDSFQNESDQTDKENEVPDSKSSKNISLGSPNWNPPKRQKIFGGKMRWASKSSNETDNKGEMDVLSKKTITAQASSELNKKKKSGRKGKRSLEDIQSPRTQKEIDYYRTHFEHVDKEVKLQVECIGRVSKRVRRQPKRLNLL